MGRVRQKEVMREERRWRVCRRERKGMQEKEGARGMSGIGRRKEKNRQEEEE